MNTKILPQRGQNEQGLSLIVTQHPRDRPEGVHAPFPQQGQGTALTGLGCANETLTGQVYGARVHQRLVSPTTGQLT